jgi:hypothetical protein
MKSVTSYVIRHHQFRIEWFRLLFIFKEDELEGLLGCRKERYQTDWIYCCVSFPGKLDHVMCSMQALNVPCKCFI